MPEVLVVSGGGGEAFLVTAPGLALLVLAAIAGGPLPSGTPGVLVALVVLVVTAVTLALLAVVVVAIDPHAPERLAGAARRAWRQLSAA